MTDDEARAIKERLQSGVQPFHVLESDIARLLSAREADRKEIEELKTAKIEAATMADQAARREERERCAGIAREIGAKTGSIKACATSMKIARAIEASDD